MRILDKGTVFHQLKNHTLPDGSLRLTKCYRFFKSKKQKRSKSLSSSCKKEDWIGMHGNPESRQNQHCILNSLLNITAALFSPGDGLQTPSSLSHPTRLLCTFSTFTISTTARPAPQGSTERDVALTGFREGMLGAHVTYLLLRPTGALLFLKIQPGLARCRTSPVHLFHSDRHTGFRLFDAKLAGFLWRFLICCEWGCWFLNASCSV